MNKLNSKKNAHFREISQRKLDIFSLPNKKI